MLWNQNLAGLCEQSPIKEMVSKVLFSAPLFKPHTAVVTLIQKSGPQWHRKMVLHWEAAGKTLRMRTQTVWEQWYCSQAHLWDFYPTKCKLEDLSDGNLRSKSHARFNSIFSHVRIKILLDWLCCKYYRQSSMLCSMTSSLLRVPLEVLLYSWVREVTSWINSTQGCLHERIALCTSFEDGEEDLTFGNDWQTGFEFFTMAQREQNSGIKAC